MQKIWMGNYWWNNRCQLWDRPVLRVTYVIIGEICNNQDSRDAFRPVLDVTHEKVCFVSHWPLLLWHVPLLCVNSETCGNTVCAWGARCVQNKCECPQCSGEAFSAVCGSDGTTYNNECELRMSSCMQKRRIEVAKPGSCDEGGEWTLKWCDYVNRSPFKFCNYLYQLTCGMVSAVDLQSDYSVASSSGIAAG